VTLVSSLLFASFFASSAEIPDLDHQNFRNGDNILLDEKEDQIERGDPASSWLAYTISKGGGKRITSINATWVVPSLPKIQTRGSEPGWWFGIEPEPALNLLQPILAWGYDRFPQYSIFNGYYEWDNLTWFSGKQGGVSPGDTIFGSITFLPESNSYEMFIECKKTGFQVADRIAVEGKIVYTDAYFVVEHQPSNCEEYPSNGEVIFSNINIELENQPVIPEWQAFQYRPACESTAHILNSSSVSFTWNPSGRLGGGGGGRNTETENTNLNFHEFSRGKKSFMKEAKMSGCCDCLR